MTESIKKLKLIFTDQWGPIVNRRLGLKWTHVVVQFENGYYYEATWPRVKRSKKLKGHTFETLELWFSDQDYRDALNYATNKLGTRYNFWGYFFPRFYGRTRGIYCSQYACEVLRAAGLPLPKGAGWSPDKLLKSLLVYFNIGGKVINS